jgi:phosphoglycerate dehydrogenase-like enzyme
MTKLKTFAFVHPLTPPQLQVYRTALPQIEFVASNTGLPDGIERAQGVALHWEAPPIDQLLAAATDLQWLHLRGAGIDRIATPRLVGSGIVVTNGSGNHAPNIAEHVLALMLAFARQLPALIRSQSARVWHPPKASQVFELSGQTLLVVGWGAIGQAIGWRAAALGMKVIGVKRRIGEAPSAGVDRIVGADQLDEVLPLAQHVALTVPLTAQTRGLISVARLQKMQPGSYLYNVGRGATVDQDALVAALASGHIAGAGLDVTDPEPLPADSPLWNAPGAVITAHSSGATPHSYARFEQLLLDNLRRFSAGEPLRNMVDKRAGY